MNYRFFLAACAAVAVSACSSSSGDDAEVSRPDASADVVETDTRITDRDVEPVDVTPDVSVLPDLNDFDTSDEDTAADTADAESDVASTPAEVIIAPGAAELPAVFADAAAGADAGPALVYPADGTLMPRNVVAPVFQWEGSTGRYRFTFRTPQRAHHVYTTDWQWTPEAAIWDRWVAEARTDQVILEVATLDNSGRLVVGPSSTLQFSAANVDGAVYFWAPSQSGIVRLPIGETAPQTFLTGTVFNCVGCHGLSPDGSRLAYTRSSGGTPIGTLGVVGTDEFQTQYVEEGRFGLYYPSFGPDNVHLAASRGGEIVILNTDTAEIVEELESPDGTSANFPAWSPRDDAIVFSAGASSGGGVFDSLGATNAGLARTRRNRDGEWTTPEWLVENGGAGGAPENLFYPAYSPDGRWVAFNRARDTAAVGGSPAGSEVWLVSAEGTSPVRLDAANGPLGTTNSWPKWAPASADGTLWVAFTSSRPYGRLDQGQAQIWVAGITPGSALPGFDPSWSAFWLPGQNLGDTNHVAYWAEYEKE